MTLPRFGYRFNRVMDGSNELANQKLRPHKLKIKGLRVLLWLHDRDHRSVGELASATSLDPSSASHIIARLESNGFVRRSRLADDARSVIVSLTPAGHKCSASLAPFFEFLDEALVKGFSQSERNMLEKFLDRIYANVLALEAEKTGAVAPPRRTVPPIRKRSSA